MKELTNGKLSPMEATHTQKDKKYLLIYLDANQIIGVNNDYLDECMDEDMLDASDVKKIKAIKVGASLCIDGNNIFIRIA